MTTSEERRLFELAESLQKLVDVERGAKQSQDEPDDETPGRGFELLIKPPADQRGDTYHPRDRQCQSRGSNRLTPAYAALTLAGLVGVVVLGRHEFIAAG